MTNGYNTRTIHTYGYRLNTVADVCPENHSVADVLSAVRQLADSLLNGVRGDNLKIKAYWETSPGEPNDYP